jgi:hypothetical protein
LFLGQIQLPAAAFEPLAEMQGEILLTGGNAGCLRIACSHFPDLVASQNLGRDLFDCPYFDGKTIFSISLLCPLRTQ